MNNSELFHTFFQGKALHFLYRIIDLSLDEDGPDLTTNAVFPDTSNARAGILVKQNCVLAGLPIIDAVLDRLPGAANIECLDSEGQTVQAGKLIAVIQGQTRQLLKAERVILNIMSRLCGIATLTRTYLQKIQGTGVRLLDTRKTAPGMRYLDKYAVLVGGGENHRLNLEDMLMLKDNHIDKCKSIILAVHALQQTYSPCPPIEVECRSLDQVKEAVQAGVQRIMLDNMSLTDMKEAVDIIPGWIESEISGRISLDNIHQAARLKPTFISCGALTHSAPPIDLSMTLEV